MLTGKMTFRRNYNTGPCLSQPFLWIHAPDILSLDTISTSWKSIHGKINPWKKVGPDNKMMNPYKRKKDPLPITADPPKAQKVPATRFSKLPSQTSPSPIPEETEALRELLTVPSTWYYW
jgi:hypothetical protein